MSPYRNPYETKHDTGIGSRGFSRLKEKPTTPGFQDSCVCLKVEHNNQKYANLGISYLNRTISKRNLLSQKLVSLSAQEGWDCFIWASTNLCQTLRAQTLDLRQRGGAKMDWMNWPHHIQPVYYIVYEYIYIYKFNRENWITPVSLLFDFLDVEERRTTSICASQLPHLEDTWLRAPDHQQGTLDVSGCMNNCAPGEKDAVRVRSSEWPWNCRRVSSELLLASTISTCTAHQQCVFVPLVLLWRVHSIFIKRWFCFVWHVFWVLRCFDVHVVHHIAPANPYCFHLLVHINPIGLHLWLAMCCWESTGRWRREWSDAWFDLELQWTNGYLISSHHVSIMLCPQSFLQFCTKI